MIRPRDRLWIAVKKLSLRKRWMALTLFSLSLGLTVFTATTSLAEGIRAAFVNTLELVVRKVPPDHVYVEARDPRAPRTVGAKESRLGAAELAMLAAIPGVVSVSPPELVKLAKLSLPLETSDPVSSLTGLEDPFLERFLPPGKRLWEVPDRVPVVMSRFALRSRYDPKGERFRLAREATDEQFLGRDIEILVGANGNTESGFHEEYKDGKKRVLRVSKEDMLSRLSEQQRYLRNRFDMNIYQRALKLPARIVGVADIERCLIPLSVARDAAAWLRSREVLALKTPVDEGEEVKEHGVLWALARTPEDVPRIAAAVKGLGLHVWHRGTRVSDAMEEFSSAMKVVRMIFYGIGGVIFLVSCLFVWSTMSKVIADSRREIGVFRAVGATRRDVLSIFLLQAGLLGMGGAVMGVGMGFGVAAGISRLVLNYATRQDLAWDVEQYGFEAEDVLPAQLFSMDPVALGAMIAAAVLASILAGLVPAWRAANMDPVAALQRRE